MTNDIDDKKIVLLMLPFWTPLNIPLGIVCLQTYLRDNGFDAEAFDYNGETKYWDIFYQYVNVLRTNVELDNQDNFINSAHYVLKQHLFLHSNRSLTDTYEKLLNKAIYYVYFQEFETSAIQQLEEIVEHYFQELEADLLELIHQEKPDIIGFSVYTGTLPSTVFAMKLVRKMNPNIKIVFGGGIFSSDLAVNSDNYQRFIKNQYVDKYLVGEGEQLLLEYMQGVHHEEVVSTAKERIDLSKVDLVNMDLGNFNVDNYTYIPLFGSRSCPFQCMFCSETILWGKFRTKSAKQVADEFEYMYETYNKQLFLMCDSLMNPYIDELSDELNKKDISIYFDGYLRAGKQASDYNKVLNWRKAGLYRARLGVESGSARILELMNKKITIDEVKNSVRNLSRAGIKTTTYLVVGYPGETEEDFQATLNLLEELKDDIYQAECNRFEYFDCGQSGSDEWGKYRNPMYTDTELDAIQMQRWILSLQPDAKEIHRRAVRFVQHCKKIGIPNPYSAREMYFADKRWNELHEQAVPPIAEFRNGIVHEDKNFS